MSSRFGPRHDDDVDTRLRVFDRVFPGAGQRADDDTGSSRSIQLESGGTPRALTTILTGWENAASRMTEAPFSRRLSP